MNDYILTCCSTADESRSFFEERNIEVIFFRWISDPFLKKEISR